MKMSTQRRRQQGTALIQFTFASLLIVPIFLGTWSFGTTFYLYSRLESAVRDGARYASMQTYDSTSSTPTANFLQAVQYMTVYGDPNANPSTATPLVPNLSTSNVQLTVTFSANNAPSQMTVSITGYSVPSYTNRVTLNGKPYVSFPFVGQWAPTNY
jgi:Flp pilus assembly protein TadG